MKGSLQHLHKETKKRWQRPSLVSKMQQTIWVARTVLDPTGVIKVLRSSPLASPPEEHHPF